MPSYVNWAKDVGLTDIVGAHAAAHSVDMRTYWRGDRPISSIDHILINKSVGSVAKYGVSNSAIWTGVSNSAISQTALHTQMVDGKKAQTTLTLYLIGISKVLVLVEYVFLVMMTTGKLNQLSF